jgi:transcriptional regulator with GAF, ATPase, and Fis domain
VIESQEEASWGKPMEDRMNLAATWQDQDQTEANAIEDNNESANARHSMTTLRELVLRVLCEVQSINEVTPVIIGSEFDFYEEVRRFEIDLIKRALLQTGGHQVRAAKLLNLKVTTLNSKIKHYNISLGAFGNVFPLIGPRESEQRPQA